MTYNPGDNEGAVNETFEHHCSLYSGTDARTVFRQSRGDNEATDSIQSLYASEIVYLNIHGRRYCKDYYVPNDEEEQTRMQMLHNVYLYFFDQKLTTTPLNNPLKILDIGTGTGEWAMAIGEEYPEAEIIGTDIAKIQPSAVPSNVFFEIDDAEVEGGWTWPKDEFDLIHLRHMQGAFKDWGYIFSEAYRHLKPGGWIEVVDFDDHKEIFPYFEENSEVIRWLTAVEHAAELSGRSRSVAHLDPSHITALGFVDASVATTMVPMGTWPDEPERQQVATHFLGAQICGAEALCLRLLTEVLKWDPLEVRRICERVVRLVKSIATDPEKANGMAFSIKVLTGRKPFPGEAPPS